MTISSRTPEGQPGICPLCSAFVVIEPSIFVGDATCPNCGQLLWFINTNSKVVFFDQSVSEIKKERVVNFIAEQLGVSADKVMNNPDLFTGADSLDTVELVMELEEELGTQ